LLPLLPTFREDLDITPRIGENGSFAYIVKDPNTQQIFEFDEKEYFICRQLNGQTPLDSVQVAFQERFGISLNPRKLETFVHQLATEGLLVSDQPLVAAAGYGIKTVPLVYPGRIFNFLVAELNWCFSPAFLIVSSLLILSAFSIAFKYFKPFSYEAKILWQPGPFFLETALGILGVNILGEVAKGIACRHYGGYVREFGLVFIYRIMPKFYVDIGESLWLMAKPDILRIFFAGLYSQFLALAIGIIAWKISSPGTGIHTFWLLFSIAGVFFFLLNAIPLIPKDGYSLLSVWFEVPHLWQRSRKLSKAWVLGEPLPEVLTPRETLGFKLFGVLSVIFEILLWPLLFILIAYLFIWQWRLKGLGALLVLMVLVLRFEGTLRRFFMLPSPSKKFFRTELGDIKVRRVVLFGLLLLFIIILFIPYPFEAGGDFKIIPSYQTAIRAQVPGEIAKVLVEENQWVEKDQPVATFLAKDQLARVQQTKAALENAQEKLIMFQNGPKPEDVAKAEQEVILATRTFRYSNTEAKRSDKMFAEKAISEQEHQAALKTRDENLEKLGVAKKNLEVVKSWPRSEEIKMQEAEIRRLQSELDLAERDLQLTTLVSPVAGKIITAFPKQKIRQYLETGNVFAVVEDSDKIRAEIELPEEDIGWVKIGAPVKLKTWAYPTKTFSGEVTAIAPVGYEKSLHRVQRSLSEKEFQIGQKELLRDEGKVIRVLSDFPNPKGLLKTDMTGYAKIKGEWEPMGIAFTHWLVRFFCVEVWSWFP
jgi:multidrug resistance efflux pump